MIEAIVTPIGAPSISIIFDCFEEDAPPFGRAGVLLLAAGKAANADFGGEAPGAFALTFSVVEFLTRSIFFDGFLFGAGFGERLEAICVLRLVTVFAVVAFLDLAISASLFTAAMVLPQPRPASAMGGRGREEAL